MIVTSLIMQSLITDVWRGRDINAFSAVQMSVSVLAPSAASALAAANWGLIFIVRGLFYLASLSVFGFFFTRELKSD